MDHDARIAAFSALGRALDGRDLDCYASFEKDPCAPILGEGDPQARICLFGRDPGRHEVRWGHPFVGAGGQKVRAGLHRALHGGDPPDFDASIAVGHYVFWANMVPFKPVDNKAWPTGVLKAFWPYVADLLLAGWQGEDVVTLGEGAFKWFGLLGPKPVKAALAEHWRREDRFEASIAVELVADDPATGERHARTLRLHPLPHPSPLNATWAPRFPGLLDARLRALELRVDSWRIAL